MFVIVDHLPSGSCHAFTWEQPRPSKDKRPLECRWRRARPPCPQPVVLFASLLGAISCPDFQCGLRIQVSKKPSPGSACVGAADRDQLLGAGSWAQDATGLPRHWPRSLSKCLHLPSWACLRGSECGRGNQLLEKRNRAPSGKTEKGKRERGESVWGGQRSWEIRAGALLA